jgi:hypothetical protein
MKKILLIILSVMSLSLLVASASSSIMKDITQVNSSFPSVKNSEVDRIVSSMNRLYKYYRAKGFDEVYFSIIPNPVTVLYPAMGRYNEIILCVMHHSGLKVHIVDVYDKFKSFSVQIYSMSDTHWSANGFNIWLNEVNKRLENFQKTTNFGASRSAVGQKNECKYNKSQNLYV